MIKRTTILMGCLCIIFAGQTLAGNTEKGPASKHITMFSKVPEGIGKLSKKRATHLCSAEESPVTTGLRSMLEPGHNKPDSAININFYYDESWKSVFSYNKDIITETIFKWEEGDWSALYSIKEEYAFDTNGNQILDLLHEYNEEGEIDYGRKYEYAYNSNSTPLYEKEYE